MLWQNAHMAGPTPLQTLDGRWHEVQNQRVILRVDLNVPLGPDHAILCDYRIRRVVGLVRRLSRLGCRVIMVSHLGRPEGRPDPALSLEPFAEPFARLLEPPVAFLRSCIGPETERAIDSSRPGSVFLMENLRFHPGETASDLEFGRELARLADIYVNDAFSVSHRPHTSVVVLPQLLPAYAGPAFTDEYLRALDLLKTMRPPLAVLSGGLKMDKLAIYRRLMPAIHSLLLGSGFAGPFAGEPEVLGDPEEVGHRVVVPPDLCVRAPGGGIRLVTWDQVTPETRAVDVGPRAVELYAEVIRNARTVLFNGALGILPPDHPHSSHNRLLNAFISTHAIKVVCGGTGCSLFIRENLARRVDYVFPGGGAILAFMDGQSNPAIPWVAYRGRPDFARAAAAYQGALRDQPV